uniref:Uncharacterized protein n=1 Tax=Arundo donax TaxID=35708 RepID=A0A0A9C1J0_ARUDO
MRCQDTGILGVVFGDCDAWETSRRILEERKSVWRESMHMTFKT